MSWFPLKPYYASLGILHKHLIYMNKFCTAYLYIISIEKNQKIHFYYLGYMICLNHVSTKKTSKENVGSKERSCALKKSFWLKHLTYFPLVSFKSNPDFLNAYICGFFTFTQMKMNVKLRFEDYFTHIGSISFYPIRIINLFART